MEYQQTGEVHDVGLWPNALNAEPQRGMIGRMAARLVNLATTPRYSGYARILDGSHYIACDWDQVMPNIDGGIWKASEGDDYQDPTFPDACQAFYDAGKPFGAYHFLRLDPYLKAGLPFPSSPEVVAKYWPKPEEDRQLMNFVNTLKNKTFQFIAVDQEAKYELGTTKLIAASWQSAVGKLFIERVTAMVGKTRPEIPMTLLYTGRWFINQFAPGIDDWAGAYPGWAGQWYWTAGAEAITWDQLKAKVPADTVKVVPFGTGEVKFHQWTADRFILPGIYTNDARRKPRTADINAFIGSVEAFKAWCKYGAATPPPQDPPGDNPDLTALTARMVKAEAEIAALKEFQARIKAA